MPVKARGKAKTPLPHVTVWTPTPEADDMLRLHPVGRGLKPGMRVKVTSYGGGSCTFAYQEGDFVTLEVNGQRVTVHKTELQYLL